MTNENNNLIELTDDNFEDKVVKSSLISVVDFWAPWCGPCKMIAPILLQVSETIDSNKVQICKMNIDDHPLTASKLGILAIPTLKLFKDGKEVSNKVGVIGKEVIINWINENIT